MSPGISRRILLHAAFCAAFALIAPAQPFPSGSAQMYLRLERLNTLGSVLMIAAHPDDEHTTLLAYLARYRHLRTGYLSLTRGEGGQNLLGAEEGPVLAAIRSQELLAARRIDGAEQLFGSAPDFGYSKTAAETFSVWDRTKILAETVRAIRQFRPDVVILRFSGTPSDGHGHHQASAIIGREAYEAAGDPLRFPEQIGPLRAWRPARLVCLVSSNTPGAITLQIGAFDPVLGLGAGEIGGISRSQHASQGMGTAQDRGRQTAGILHLAGSPLQNDIMDGIDATWSRVTGAELAGKHLADARKTYDPQHPDRLLEHLIAAHRALFAINTPWAVLKRSEVAEAILDAASVRVDMLAKSPTVVDGDEVSFQARITSRSSVPVTLLSVAGPAIADQKLSARIDKDTEQNIFFRGRMPALEPGSTLECQLTLEVGGQPVDLTRTALYRYVHEAWGERSRPVQVMPAVTANFDSQLLFFPDSRPREIQVTLQSFSGTRAGRWALELPEGWKASPAFADYALNKTGESQTIRFVVTPPASAAVGSAFANANNPSLSRTQIDYPHIPPFYVIRRAALQLVRADVRTLVKEVGYLPGVGDRVPEALRQIGLSVTPLNPRELMPSQLGRFDAIVTGVRAYNLLGPAQLNPLLEYVSAGGTLLVQYNVLGDTPPESLGPYDIKLSRGRVSVETTPVQFTQHALLTAPNKITPEDFNGWVQERGLYFPGTWDKRYSTVLTMSDPGEPPLSSGLLYVRYGKGVYIYTPLSFFRQLPAGVPGAFRLFANLISAGKTIEATARP